MMTPAKVNIGMATSGNEPEKAAMRWEKMSIGRPFWRRKNSSAPAPMATATGAFRSSNPRKTASGQKSIRGLSWAVVVVWIPAFAGMTGMGAGMTGMGARMTGMGARMTGMGLG